MFTRAVQIQPDCVEALSELRLINMRREKSRRESSVDSSAARERAGEGHERSVQIRAAESRSAVKQIWLDGALRRLVRRRRVHHPHPYASLRSRRVRGHPLLSHDDDRSAVSSSSASTCERLYDSAHINLLDIPFPHGEGRGPAIPGDSLRREPSGRGLHPPPRLHRGRRDGSSTRATTRSAWRSIAWPWGKYLGEEGHGARHPRQGVDVLAPSRQRQDDEGQDLRRLRELDSRQTRGPARTDTTRRSCSTPTGSSPRPAARTSSSCAMVSCATPNAARRAGRHHAIDGDRDLAGTRAYPVEGRTRSRATSCTWRTRCSSPAPPPRSRRSVRSTAGRSATVRARSDHARSSSRRSSTWSQGRERKYERWLTHL